MRLRNTLILQEFEIHHIDSTVSILVFRMEYDIPDFYYT